jgi:hypothetical protein
MGDIGRPATYPAGSYKGGAERLLLFFVSVFDWCMENFSEPLTPVERMAYFSQL